MEGKPRIRAFGRKIRRRGGFGAPQDELIDSGLGVPLGWDEEDRENEHAIDGHRANGEGGLQHHR
jgi:hypothetical protein